MNTTLVLTAACEPVKIVSWDKAFRQLLKKRAHLVNHYVDHPILAGPGGTLSGELRDILQVDLNGCVAYKRPSIIRQNKYYGRRKIVRFSRDNVYLRDGGVCQFCGKAVSRSEFTYDHVIPRALGGTTCFENVVVSCVPCNQKKGGRMPKQAGMHLITTPVVPKYLPGVFGRILRYEPEMPADWKDYLAQDDSSLYWTVPLVRG